MYLLARIRAFGKPLRAVERCLSVVEDYPPRLIKYITTFQVSRIADRNASTRMVIAERPKGISRNWLRSSKKSTRACIECLYKKAHIILC